MSDKQLQHQWYVSMDRYTVYDVDDSIMDIGTLQKVNYDAEKVLKPVLSHSGDVTIDADKLVELISTLQTQCIKIHYLTDKVEDLMNGIEQKDMEIDAKYSEIGDLQIDIDDKQSEIDHQQELLDEKETELSNLKEELQEKEESCDCDDPFNQWERRRNQQLETPPPTPPPVM